MSYLEAYGMLLGAGRKARKGFHVRSMYDKMFSVTITEPHMTVERFIKEVACFGNWIIGIRGHVLAVVNSNIHDTNPTASLRCHVEKAWKVK
jgi:hypothetical protein